jgi:hypothetical protein
MQSICWKRRGDGLGPLFPLLKNLSMVPREEDLGKNSRSWRFGATEDAVDQGQAQTHSTLGRAVHDCGGSPTRHLPTEGQQQQHPHQHLEHQEVTSFLPLNSIPSHAFIQILTPTAPRPSTLGPCRSGSHGGTPPRAPLPLFSFESHTKNKFFFHLSKRANHFPIAT